MPTARSIIDALRVAALWLTLVSVVGGPPGLGGPAAFASADKTCGVSCPCDETPRADEHAEVDPCDEDGTADGKHDDGDADKDECSDDCLNCSCCPGIAMAVLPLRVAASRATCTSSSRMLAPIVAPVSGMGCSVFRPPRSLT